MVNGVLTYQWSNPVQSCNVTILPGSGRIAGSNIGDNEEETAKVSPEVTLATYYQLNVYPNPSANTNVVVEMNENTISEISVCDASGKIIYKESNVNKNSSVLTTDTWKQGIYLVLVKHNNGISYRKLLIE
ncbi:MAG: T9SS type A sorting domain-containing protein [Bacteroidota bacterium]|nr:T9SS type A sorting domain-containing protein [Bacteroidota bacterium]